MYIFIFEDGQVKQANSVSDEDLLSVDNGYLQVLRVQNGDATEYYDGEWSKLEPV
jgi:hypothetical protein